MAKIIGIVQVKGGAGRSTVATNLAAAVAKNASTALVDCDMPQGTSLCPGMRSARLSGPLTPLRWQLQGTEPGGTQ